MDTLKTAVTRHMMLILMASLALVTSSGCSQNQPVDPSQAKDNLTIIYGVLQDAKTRDIGDEFNSPPTQDSSGKSESRRS